MPYQVKFGGKDGKAIELVESPDLVAIRTKNNEDLGDVAMSRKSRELVQQSSEVASFPEAGVTVRRVHASDDLEAVQMRDETRTSLKQEENIRFAGRVLQDATSGEVMLYTENFFLKFKDEILETECLAVIEKYNLKIKSKLVFATNAYFVQAPEGTGQKVFDIADLLLHEPPVEYCHPELVQERRFKVIHPLQWHLAPTRINDKPVDAHINVEAAWAFSKGKGITIAIIDDGIDIDHPEFAGRIVHPYDATLDSNDPRPKFPDDNHGTACAGLACAAGLEQGASGTAPEAFLMPIRLRSGLGSMAEANAFAWAADHGADVISCSWGPTDGEWWNPDDPVHMHVTPMPDSTRLAIDYARNKGRKGKGCAILFAAGNGNEDIANDGYSGNPNIITVAACNDTGKRSVYSDFGKNIWISFPSGDYAFKPYKHPAPISSGLRTTDRVKREGYTPENYLNTFGGTSGACPGMAGVCALILGVNPNLSFLELKELIRISCQKIDAAEGEYDSNGHSIWYGFGRIDAGLAVKNALAAKNNLPPIPGSTGGSGVPLIIQETDLNAELEGIIRFSTVGSVRVQPGIWVGNFVPARRVIGMALRLKNIDPQKLRLRYQVNIPSVGLIENEKEGEYLGSPTGRMRIVGFSLQLEGPAKPYYTIEYSAQFEGDSISRTFRDGEMCGTDQRIGTGILMVNLALRLRKPDLAVG